MGLESLTAQFASLSADVIIVAVLITVLGIDSARNGSGRALALAFAFLLTALLAPLLFDAALIGGTLASLPDIGGAIAVLMLASILFVICSRLTGGYAESDLLRAVAAACGAAAVVVVSWTLVPALTALWPFALVTSVIAPPYAFFALFAGLAALAYARA